MTDREAAEQIEVLALSPRAGKRKSRAEQDNAETRQTSG